MGMVQWTNPVHGGYKWLFGKIPNRQRLKGNKMKFHTVIPYKLKRLIPMAMIAGMPVFAASCDKEPQYHDTTYVWGIDNYDPAIFGPRITASIDSTLVNNVIMLNDGKSWHGAPPQRVLWCIDKIMSGVESENKEKIRWAGTLEDIGLDEQRPQTYRDSATLAQMGLKFGRVHYAR